LVSLSWVWIDRRVTPVTVRLTAPPESHQPLEGRCRATA